MERELSRDEALARAEGLLQAYGADIARWPAEGRDWFVHLTQPVRAAVARHIAQSEAAALDRLLDRVTIADADAGLSDRILAAARQPAMPTGGAARRNELPVAPVVAARNEPHREVQLATPAAVSGAAKLAARASWRSAAMFVAAAVLGLALGWFEPVLTTGNATESAAAQALFGTGELDIDS